jgi:hypothetical protein
MALPYHEGSLFAVPLRTSGYAVGVVEGGAGGFNHYYGQ